MPDMAAVLAETGQGAAMTVPGPHPELVTRRVLVMERLDGFAFDDVAGMQASGIDTARVVTAGMVAFLEVAMLFGVFHGDLHGGYLFVLAAYRVSLPDFLLSGRLNAHRPQAFLTIHLYTT